MLSFFSLTISPGYKLEALALLKARLGVFCVEWYASFRLSNSPFSGFITDENWRAFFLRYLKTITERNKERSMGFSGKTEAPEGDFL